MNLRAWIHMKGCNVIISPPPTILRPSNLHSGIFICPFYPSALRVGGVLSSRSGRAGGRADCWAGGCQTCGTNISVTACWIFSVRSSMELSRPVVVHCHAHMPICPIWACPWAKNLVKFATNWVQTLRIAYLWNHWMDLPHLKFHGLV